jgi:polysaccharide export outer membrane protein
VHRARNFFCHKNISRLSLLLIVALCAVGCIPQRETVILQPESDGENPYGKLESITERYMLRVNDQLYISVSTPDPKISSFFNPQTGISGGNISQTQGFMYYPIDDSMNIDFPYVGKINLAGCNVMMAKEKIRQSISPLLQEFSLNVRLASNSFTALGEFGNPGVHTMKKDQMTILEAIAISGDFRIYAKRKEIKLFRNTPEGMKTYVIDITDKRIVNSDLYYIYPNDVLYVRPMKAKYWGIGESFSFGLVTSLLALTLTVRTVIF